MAVLVAQRQHAAADGLDLVGAAIFLDHFLDNRSRRVGRDDVAGQDLDELSLVLRLEQIVDRALRQFGEGLIGRRENGERPLPFQRLDEAGGLDRRDKRRVVLGVDGVLDDVFRGVHGRAADHRVLGIGHTAQGGKGDGAGENGGEDIASRHKTLPG